jgi:hypothetical protein
MEELMQETIATVGKGRATAEKIIAFRRDHADDVGNALARSGVGGPGGPRRGAA